MAKPVKYQTVPKAMSSNPTGSQAFSFLSLLDVGLSLWDQSNASDLIGFIVAPELERSVLDVIKASMVVIYGRITIVSHSPCYETFLRP